MVIKMAFDGTVIANIVHEMQCLRGARISKINQPESDELLLTFSGASFRHKKLLISAGASLPLMYFTEENKPNPASAPSFCMLLRKHIGGGHVISVSQPSLERIVRIRILHLDEMGDTREKSLVVELMGKYSNIIFTDEEDCIIDSIKRVPSTVSSLREVLPGRQYFLPSELTKADTLHTDRDTFLSLLRTDDPAARALYTSYSGISPVTAEELCHRACIDPDFPLNAADEQSLWEAFTQYTDDISAGRFDPQIYYRNGEPFEFSAMPLTMYAACEHRSFETISEVLETYYREKEAVTRIRQRSADLRRITDTAISRTAKKLDLQEKQMKDTEKRDRFRTYGELLRAYAYCIEPGQSSVTLQDYNDDYREITVPLDADLSVSENANRYYDRYQKMRRTAIALKQQIGETKAALEHLRSIETSLSTAASEGDLAEIKDELTQAGYIRKQARSAKEKQQKGTPLHFISCDGFDIYVGKNNYQNEAVTFGLAGGDDWWFHAKNRPGSHVIVKSSGSELSDRAFEEAAALAAHFSSASKGEKVEIDYTQRRNLRKPPAAHPGLVIYHTNYSMISDGDISTIRIAEK